GGDITAQSVPGLGSVFTLTIDPGSLAAVEFVDNPKEAMIAATGNVQTEAMVVQLSGRVLLAEDGFDNQRLISYRVQQAGAEVTLAENGRIAYDKAMEAWEKGEPYDVILMDMQMPEMDGYTATQKLRSEGYRGPIIALTAHAMSGDRDKCIQAGCDEYTTKPIKVHELLELIAKFSKAPVIRADQAEAAGMPETQHLAPDPAPATSAPLGMAETSPSNGGEDLLLSDFANDPDMADLVEIFIDSLAERLIQIETAVEAGDLDSLERTSHQIAGAAGGYGYPSITVAARDVENRIRSNGQMGEILEATSKLSTLCSRARRSFTAQ
ncbi:MAG: response regulator, partial [Myxococcota bacterium]|nr:response regulator [Myxococcota bacterium]